MREASSATRKRIPHIIRAVSRVLIRMRPARPTGSITSAVRDPVSQSPREPRQHGSRRQPPAARPEQVARHGNQQQEQRARGVEIGTAALMRSRRWSSTIDVRTGGRASASSTSRLTLSAPSTDTETSRASVAFWRAALCVGTALTPGQRVHLLLPPGTPRSRRGSFEGPSGRGHEPVEEARG